MIVVGMISGTSADGIEVAVVDISGAPPRLAWRLVKHTHVDFEPALREEIFAAFRPETGTVDRLCALNFSLGRAFAKAALDGIAAAGVEPQDVDLIGSHGQTVWHIPDGPDASTLQLGEAAVIAEKTGITTISNFRTRDMAAEGQGAPLVAYPDVLLLTDPTRTRAALNLGGIANFTYLPPAHSKHPERSAFPQEGAESKDPSRPRTAAEPKHAERIAAEPTHPERSAAKLKHPERNADELKHPERSADELKHPERSADELKHPERSATKSKDASAPQHSAQETPFAFDTGPGNMLIDYAASRATDGALGYDRDGALAARGEVSEPLLAELLVHPYLLQPPPKTTGRELFGAQYGALVWEQGLSLGLRPEDIVATLTALTARSIRNAYRRFLPAWSEQTIVSGGGAANPTLMSMLAHALAPSELIRSEALGVPTDAKEAIAFAVLAYETWAGRPGNLPGATGAAHEVVLGDITPGRRRPRVRPEAAVWGTGAAGSAAGFTEARNPASMYLDILPAGEIVALMNQEDKRVAEAVEAELGVIAEAVERIVERMRGGGRLIYAGAGTSGRLAVLDAAECPPTFSAPPGLVVGLIAGGKTALTHAVEGAEDNVQAGRDDIAGLNVGANDTVVGVAASGRTPYVVGAMEEAKRRGALVIGLACNRPSPVGDLADLTIAPLVGPEVLTGSTRLKAGTAQKMILNMLSTATMVQLGKAYSNLMVDVQATNAKLRDRAWRIVAEACGVPGERAAKLLEDAGGEVKVAIVMELAGLTAAAARARLQDAVGVVRAALKPDALQGGSPVDNVPGGEEPPGGARA